MIAGSQFRNRAIALVALAWLVGSSERVRAEEQAAKPITPPVLLQMIRDDSVHRELKLTSDQISRVRDALTNVDGDWFRSRNLPSNDQITLIAKLTRRLDQDLQKILKRPQVDRLRQLERQALGTRMVTRTDVQAALDLTNSQLDRFEAAFVKTDQANQAIQKKVNSRELDPAKAAKQVVELQTTERETVVGSLTDAQRSKLGGLTGSSFDFARVERSLPSAPEITQDGVTWIQGGPLKMEDLRGKVVAVHFYAYQCINCIRNLPHYSAWHRDYADQGLVVIGIQSPETANERKLDRVAAAVKEKDMRYPVAMDLEMANWNQWGTRMWPSVYLVDKKGYLRKWWYGEMNWKGTEGEKQMRQFVEKLLAE